jgi:p-hydroxybenzoate 3-monooxygenase
MKTQVAIIGAGPAGLMLGHLLRQAGIDVVILERQSAVHVSSRIRAGVLEQVTTDILDRIGVGTRMHAEGLPHDGFNLADGERLVRIDIHALTGKRVMVYGQTELTRDLIEAAPARGLEILWEATNVQLNDINGSPWISFLHAGANRRLDAVYVAGCDGFHGVSRMGIPGDTRRQLEKVYPFGWLGILADVPPCNHELIYANHPHGFALASMRSPTRSRYYIQVPLTEKIEDWPDDRLWDELALRLGPEAGSRITRGPALEKSIAPLRSFVSEPMRHGSLFLAKGLNLAASDVHYLSEALTRALKKGDVDGLDAYSARALARVWKAERFSWSLTLWMHRFPEAGQFDRRMQMAELAYIAQSEAAQRSLAENYVGLPL